MKTSRKSTKLSSGARQTSVLSTLLFTHLTQTEIQQLMDWCKFNNISLNVSKMKQMVVEFRQFHTVYPPVHNKRSTVVSKDHQMTCSAPDSWPHLVPQYLLLSQVSTLASSIPMAAKEDVISQFVLQGHSWECSDQLHHCRVFGTTTSPTANPTMDSACS